MLQCWLCPDSIIVSNTLMLYFMCLLHVLLCEVEVYWWIFFFFFWNIWLVKVCEVLLLVGSIAGGSYRHKHCTKNKVFLLRISSKNVIRSTVSWGFGHIYWKNLWWKTLFFVQWSLWHSTSRTWTCISLNEVE